MKKLQQFLDICPIRWVEKVTELTDFEELFALIEFCLKEMCLNTGHVQNYDTAAKATSFSKLRASFDLI